MDYLDKYKNRNSNIELLRIIAMILIVISHFFVHGIKGIFLKVPEYFTFQNELLFTNILTNYLGRMGNLGVGIYFVITAFFSVDIKQIKYKSIIKLIFQTIFYNIICWCIYCTYVFFSHREFSASLGIIKVMYNTISPISSFSYWFITAYCFLLFVIPEINKILEKLTKKQFYLLCSFLLIFEYLIPNIMNSSLYAFQRAITFYCIGWGIRKGLIESDTIKEIILFCITTIFGLFLQYIDIYKFQTNIYMSQIIGGGFDLLCIPIQTICIFNIFRRLQIRDIKLINFFSALTIGVYLFHENFFSRYFIWQNLNFNRFYGTKYYFLLCVISVLGIFIIGYLIELIRIICFGKIENNVINLFQKEEKSYERKRN